ncbi:hypothetical protein F3I16_16140 [Pseudomonas sp. L-22-4S-12]|uniref:hypothetical protein n=1 Tax=Pseudomonas sp. L-22-4S-12 TaxID=2610893 RepID=UPI00132763F0|nr:hypothetical protein [Pseudomonas sp. L-22-4S-12]MWV17573.1 hypothetical protein [Pseudomonas sp. L-22-4S-12]
MSGGGKKGGDNTIKDTPEQRYAAQIAAEKWNYAQEVLAPLEDEYMQRVDQFDSAGRMSYLRGVTNQSSQAQLSQGLADVGGQLGQAGINPNSGRWGGTMTDFAGESALQGGETMGRAQFQQTAEKTRGLQNVVAIGSGQAGQAQTGLSDIASQSAIDARHESANAFNRRSANLQLLGGIAGAGANFAMGKLGTSGNGSAGLNLQGQSQPLTNNPAYVRNM